MKRVIWYLIISAIMVSLLIAGCSQPAATTTPPASTKPVATSTVPSTQSTTAPQPGTTQPSPSATTPAAAGGVIKIGHMRPLTGGMAATSDLMTKAFDWAFQQVNYQVAGKQIQIIMGDSKGDTATALDVARKMVENDKVAMIVGPTQSGETTAVSAYMEQAGVPMMITNPTNASIMAQHRKWTISAGGTQPGTVSPMAFYLADKTNIKKVDIMAADDAGGHGNLNAFMAAFKKKGGQIVQEQYTPPTQDFAPYLTVLKPADALVTWYTSDQAIKFLSQYHELGIDKKLPLVGAFHGSFLAPVTLNVLPPADADATIGDLVPTPYSPLLDTPFNKKFVADYQAKFNGTLPDDTETGPYQGAMIIIAALKATNGDITSEKLRQALLAVNFDGPEGPVKFDADTSASIKTIYICKVVKQGGIYTWQPVTSYKDVPPGGL